MSRGTLSVDFKISRFTRLLGGTAADMTKKGDGPAPAMAPAESKGEAHNISTPEKGASVARGDGKPPVTTARKPSNASRNLMSNYLKRGREDGTIAQEKEAKRHPQRGDEGDEEVELEDMEDTGTEDREEPWQTKLRMTMMEAAGLTPEQARICMQHIKKTFQEKVAEEARRIAKKVFREDGEIAKCKRSILMHNADKWVAGDQSTFGYSLSERVTAAVHRMSGGMVAVVDCFTVGAWQAGKAPSSVFLSFGSYQQKSTFFRIMANRVRFGSEQQQNIRVLACRDAFPKDLIPEARSLAQKGLGLRQNGIIASFRVVARGQGCIPVLEVRERVRAGQPPARWSIYQEPEEEDRAAGGGDATPARGRTASGGEEWQVAGGRRRVRNEQQQEQEKARNKGTPRKVASDTGRLSVPQPGTFPPLQEGEDMDEDIVRFPEGTDEERYVEPY